MKVNYNYFKLHKKEMQLSYVLQEEVDGNEICVP
jgi:hypothetical protein